MKSLLLAAAVAMASADILLEKTEGYAVRATRAMQAPRNALTKKQRQRKARKITRQAARK